MGPIYYANLLLIMTVGHKSKLRGQGIQNYIDQSARKSHIIPSQISAVI